jgi:DNA invertase Pin-like site-specific DNA recombinase
VGKKHGVALLSLEEKIDTSSAAGDLVFHVFGAIAQFEPRLIAERTRDGMNAGRAKRKKPGRPGSTTTSSAPRYRS